MVALDIDEKIIYEVRKHWFGIAVIIAGLAVIALIPPIFFVVIQTTGTVMLVDGWLLFLFVYSLWLLVLWVFFFLEWTDYYFDVWHVTNKRLVDVEQKGIFSREITSFYYDRIQDITIEIHGIIPTLLEFGDIHIQTAGESREIILKGASRPYMAKEIIMKEVEKKSGTIQRVQVVE